MTRKQALELVVRALAGSEEAVQVLHTMIDELPLNRWTEAAIRDSVEQFILDNGRHAHPSRGWYAFAKYNHTRRWCVLLEKLKLPTYSNLSTPPSVSQLKVRVILDYDIEEEEKGT